MTASETITEAEFDELTQWQPYIDDDLMREIESDCQDHSHGVNRRILPAPMIPPLLDPFWRYSPKRTRDR